MDDIGFWRTEHDLSETEYHSRPGPGRPVRMSPRVSLPTPFLFIPPRQEGLFHGILENAINTAVDTPIIRTPLMASKVPSSRCFPKHQSPPKRRS